MHLCWSKIYWYPECLRIFDLRDSFFPSAVSWKISSCFQFSKIECRSVWNPIFSTGYQGLSCLCDQCYREFQSDIPLEFLQGFCLSSIPGKTRISHLHHKRKRTWSKLELSFICSVHDCLNLCFLIISVPQRNWIYFVPSLARQGGNLISILIESASPTV